MVIIISKGGKDAKRVDKSEFEHEKYLQNYIQENPDSIPLYEISEDIRLLILMREFRTESGPIDALGIDKDGGIYLVETKLYKNPDKRLVVAQVLDYGASLWGQSADFVDFLRRIEEEVSKKQGVSLNQRIKNFFGLSDDEVSFIINNMKKNLNEGNFKFVVLMDELHPRLKNLITFINKNSQFSIYAVELEYYKYDQYEIMIPNLYGAEVRKHSSEPIAPWNWESFSQKLGKIGQKEVAAARAILEWADKNHIKYDWTSSQRGAFILIFDSKKNTGFYPFSVTGEGKVEWNAPHQGNYSPAPFNKPEKRRELLIRLKAVKGATVDVDIGIERYRSLNLPLHILADKKVRNKFFEVLFWIKKSLES